MRNGMMTMKYELGRMCEETVMVTLRYCPETCLQGLRQTIKTISQELNTLLLS